MAYPIQCHAGFPMPLVAGKFEIVGFSATINDPTPATASAQIAFFDDETISKNAAFGNLIAIADIYQTKTLLIDIKRQIIGTLANTDIDNQISYFFPESIKTRHGISIAADNIKGGSICLYRR